MRSLAVLAVLAVVAVTLAGCANDPERYPNGVSSTSSKSASKSSTGTSHSTTGSASSSGTHGPGGNGTNGAGLATANLTATPMNGTAPLNVTFVLSGNGTSWSFLYGDGNKTNGTTLPTTLVHQFTGGGNFTPKLTVMNGSASATATVNLTVAPGSVGFAPGLDPNCQRPDAVMVPGADIYFDDRGSPAGGFITGGGTWVFQESNDIPGLQLTQEPGATPPTQPADVDPIAVQFNCQNGDTLIE